MSRRVLVGIGLVISMGVAPSAGAGTGPVATSTAKGVRVVVECDRPAFANAARRWAHRPAHIDLRCRNGASISDVNWGAYGKRRAAGEGDVGLFSEGFKRAYPVAFELHRVKRCRAARARIFTRITYVFTDKRPKGTSARGREKLPCGRGELAFG